MILGWFWKRGYVQDFRVWKLLFRSWIDLEINLMGISEDRQKFDWEWNGKNGSQYKACRYNFFYWYILIDVNQILYSMIFLYNKLLYFSRKKRIFIAILYLSLLKVVLKISHLFSIFCCTVVLKIFHLEKFK